MSRSLMSTETTRQSRIEIITSFFSILAGEAPMKAREFICCDEGVMFETSVTVTIYIIKSVIDQNHLVMPPLRGATASLETNPLRANSKEGRLRRLNVKLYTVIFIW